MINLYIPENENFNKNGDMILMPISCEVEPTINGSWVLSLLHPIDAEDRWKSIVVNAVVKVDSFNGSQLFRLKTVTKQDSGIEAQGEPIFMDSIGDCFIINKRPTNVGGQQALSQILEANPKYSARSNIAKVNTAYYYLQNAMECIASDNDNSFLNRWGGEIEYNNYQIIINEHIGEDNGVQLLYGKNIVQDGMRETVNMESVVTRIVPKAYNGYTISPTPYVDSPLINSYPTIITKVIEYPNIRLKADVQGDEEGIIVCNTKAQLYAALRQAANEEYANGIDKPLVSIECDMVLLQNTEEYKDFAELERVSLGDTIHCKHNRLGIVTDARVVSMVWDCITKSVKSVSIGTVELNFLDRVASSVNATEKALTKGGQVVGGQIEGIINGANARVIAQANGVEPQQEKVILFEDLDSTSSTFGAMALGTTGFMISDTRNASDTDWVWSTFGTGKGFSADLIKAGTLSAINIIGSVITGGTISGATITGNTITGGTISGSKVTTSGSRSGDPVSPSTVFDYTSSLEDGEIIFTRKGRGTTQYDGTIAIQGGGLTADFDTAAMKTTVSNVIQVASKNNDQKATYGLTVLVTSSQGNYTRITGSNIEIYQNGTKVWSAR